MKTVIISIFIILSTFTTYAQQRDIVLTGTATDHQNEPLPGATIRIKNIQFSTVTDTDGHYLLRDKWKENDLILFFFIGMKEIHVKYTGRKVQDAAMQEDPKALDEVVIVARQNINELDIRAKPGVIQRVDVERFNSKPMIDVSLTLQGAVSGLITTNTGDLGSKPEIRTRGNLPFRKGDTASEPLYVMDGKVISPDAFTTLNPADIQEIKVLKDAVACTLYGIKAADGVIEITSQRGNPDERLTTSYSFNIGITTRGRRGVKIMDSEKRLELERRLQNISTPGYGYSKDYYRKHYATAPNLDESITEGRQVLDSLKNIHTDWFDELIHRSIYQRHNLSMKRGTDKTSYCISTNYAKQGGRVPGNDTQRFTARMNLDRKLGNWGYFSLNTDADYSATGAPSGSTHSPTDLVYQLNPYETKAGKLISYSEKSSEYTLNDSMSQYHSKSTDKRGGVSGSFNLRPFKGLEIDTVTGIDFLLSEALTLIPSTLIVEREVGIAIAGHGKLTKEEDATTNISSNIRITYNKTFAGRHNLTTGGNMDYYLTQTGSISATRYGAGAQMSLNAINHSITGARKPTASSLLDKTAQLGFGVVTGYSFDSTYDLFATYRADASSVLPPDKRWNAAWAVGLGWTLSRYPFLKSNKVITFLDLKGPHGRMANLSGVSVSATIDTFSYSTNYHGNARLLQSLGFYNTDLKPEQTSTTDFSLSIEFFKQLTSGLNLYRRETSDALLDVPILLSNGFSTMKRNTGVLRNESYELDAAIKVLDTPDWRVSLRGSLAYSRNKVISLYYTDRLYTGETALTPDYEVGKAYNVLYGLKSLGVNPITGFPILQGANGSEIPPTQNPARENFIALGHSTPPYSGTFDLNFSYRNFDLDMDFYYVSGGIKPYNYSYICPADSANKNVIQKQLENTWFHRGDEGKIYHSPFYISPVNASFQQPNTETVGKSDYLKLTVLLLRYRAPYIFLGKNCHFIKYANIAFQVSNLFMITPYKEPDPETGSLAGTMQPVLTVNFSLTF